MIKAVIFDLDGTLIDSSEGITKCAQYALRHFGIEEPDPDRLRVFIGPPLYQSFMMHYGFSLEQAREAVVIYRERYHKTGIYECSLYPGVRECLVQLQEAGYRIGMASSKPEPSCRTILKYFAIDGFFDEIVGSTMDGRIETKPDVLNELFHRLPDVPKEEMILVGDTIYDIDGANAAGIAGIAVSFGFGNMEQMLKAGALGPCEAMEKLPALLKELNSASCR